MLGGLVRLRRSRQMRRPALARAAIEALGVPALADVVRRVDQDLDEPRYPLAQPVPVGAPGRRGVDENIQTLVRQVRGESCSQVDGVETSLVTSGEGVPTSALLLRDGS